MKDVEEISSVILNDRRDEIETIHEISHINESNAESVKVGHSERIEGIYTYLPHVLLGDTESPSISWVHIWRCDAALQQEELESHLTTEQLL